MYLLCLSRTDRLFVLPVDAKQQHSFVVAADLGGLSGRLACHDISSKATVRELRNKIEIQSDRCAVYLHLQQPRTA